MNINEMTPEQIFLAENIIKEARAAGVNPDFALRLLFQESQFSPAAIGDDPKEVLENIRASMGMINNLRESLGNDPAAIAAGFFAGEAGERFTETKDINDLPPEAIITTSDLLSSFGGNVPSVFALPAELADNPFMSELPEDFGDQTISQPQPTIKQIQDQKQIESETDAGRTYGAGAGAMFSAGKGALDLGSAVVNRLSGAARAPTGGGALPGPGQALTPGQKWAQAVTGVVKPGAQTVVDAASDYRRIMPSGKVSKPLAQKYGINAPLDIARIAAQNAPQGGLQSVTNMFQRMAQTPLGQAAATAGRATARYGIPPLTVAAGGGELLGGIQEMRKDNPDPVELALRGLGVLGTGMSLFPPTMAVGVPLALGAPLLRENRKKGPVLEPQSLGLMAP